MVKDNIFQDNIFHCLSAIFLCFILVFGSNSYPLENCLGGVSAAPDPSVLDSLLANSTAAKPPSMDQVKTNTGSSHTNRGSHTKHVKKSASSDLDELSNNVTDELTDVPVKKGTLDQYCQASANVANTIEYTHKLPNNVTVGNTTINMPGYLDGATKQILYIKNNKINNTVLPVNRTAPTSSVDTVTTGTMTKTEYLDLINKTHIAMANGVAPRYITSTNHRSFGYENLIYITSQILYSYSMSAKLPDFIVAYPWTTVKSNSSVFIPMSGLGTATDTVQSYIEFKHRLPSNVTIGSNTVNMAAMLRIEARTLINLDGNLYQSILLKGKYNVPSTYQEDNINNLNLNKVQYLGVAINVNDWINSHDLTAPEYADSIRGKIGFKSLVYLFAGIINSGVHNNGLASNVPLSTWAVVSNNNTSFISMDQVNVAAEFVKQNIEVQHSIPTTVKINGKDIRMSNFLYLILKSVSNTHNNYYGSIVLNNYGDAQNSLTETINGPKRVGQGTYINTLTNALDFYQSYNRSPTTLDIQDGDIRWENAVLMYSQILTFSNVNNYMLPSYVYINKWSVVTSNTAVSFTTSQVMATAATVKSYIETHHSIPDTVTVGSSQMDVTTYFKLMVSTVNLIASVSTGQLLLISYAKHNLANPYYSHKDGSTLNMTKYLGYAEKLEWDIYINKTVPSVKCGVRFENWLYTYSQVLNSYKICNTLPDLVMITPWRVINNAHTKFFTVNDIATTAEVVQSFVETNHRLPLGSTVVVAGVSMTTATFLRLMTTAVSNINGNLNTTIVSLVYILPVGTAESIRAGSMNKTTYLKVTKYIKNYFDDDGNNEIAQDYSSYTGLGIKDGLQ